MWWTFEIYKIRHILSIFLWKWHNLTAVINILIVVSVKVMYVRNILIFAVGDTMKSKFFPGFYWGGGDASQKGTMKLNFWWWPALEFLQNTINSQFLSWQIVAQHLWPNLLYAEQKNVHNLDLPLPKPGFCLELEDCVISNLHQIP